MTEWQFSKDVRNQSNLRKSFNQLATETFGINFEDWYEKGYWTEKYEPFSFLDGEKVVANVSVNKLNILLNGEIKKAIQIGTVMTHPNYRNKGLSARLMNKVLEEYENEVDLFYLFANTTVLNYYPKFGFKPIDEHQYMMDFNYKNELSFEEIRRLDGAKDLPFIYEFASERYPISTRFSTTNTQELLMFYCIYVFNQDIYYLEQEDVIVIYKHENEELHVFDIISKTEMRIENIVKKIGRSETEKVVFHFTLDDKGVDLRGTLFHGSEVLFVKTNLSFSDSFKHPLTSQA